MQERHIGDIRIGRAHELTLKLPVLDFFPDTTEDDWAPHAEWLAAEGGYEAHKGGRVLLPVQSYLIRTTHHTIVVDTCMGNDKDRPGTPWTGKSDTVYLDNLAAAGVSPGDVDLVLCTHLHLDHVGWNTRLVDGRWEPTFPNARYLFSATEYQHAVAGEVTPEVADSVVPVVEAGRADLVDGDHAIDDEVRLEPTPGHTPGHYAVHLTSGTEEMVIGGDLMHSPVQCRHPEWRSQPDWDPDLARATRRSFMERYADTDTLVAMAHFPMPSAGRFESHGDAFRFRYDDRTW